MKLTPTQQRLYDLLSDGQPHDAKELIACLYDPEMGSLDTVYVHLMNMRKVLRPHGLDITSYSQYRLVRPVTSGE